MFNTILKKHRRSFSRKGFTLTETLVTIAIFTIVMMGVTALFQYIFVTSTQQRTALSTIDNARINLFTFTNEIRSGGYGNDGSYPLNQASDSQIIFFSSFGTNSSTTVNRIRYYLSGTTLYKGVITPTGNPLDYNTNQEVVTAIQTNVMNSSSTPLFTYYDGNYSGTSSALTQPVSVIQVKFVRMNMNVLQQDVRNGTTTFAVSAGGTIRNLKTNLGN